MKVWRGLASTRPEDDTMPMPTEETTQKNELKFAEILIDARHFSPLLALPSKPITYCSSPSIETLFFRLRVIVDE